MPLLEASRTRSAEARAHNSLFGTPTEAVERADSLWTALFQKTRHLRSAICALLLPTVCAAAVVGAAHVCTLIALLLSPLLTCD